MFSAKKDVPKQHLGKTIEGQSGELIQGIAGGVIGGSIGMMIPSLTAGVGNTFARHAVAQSGDRSFMFSQGVSRSIYYIGAVLLLFIPGVIIRRGGAALFITMFYVPNTYSELLIIAATVLISTALYGVIEHIVNRVVYGFVLPFHFLNFGVCAFALAWQPQQGVTDREPFHAVVGPDLVRTRGEKVPEVA